MSLSDMYDSGEVDERVQELIESDKLTNDLMWESLGPDAFTRRSKDYEIATTTLIKRAIQNGNAQLLGKLMIMISSEYLFDHFAEQAEQDCIDREAAKAEDAAEGML